MALQFSSLSTSACGLKLLLLHLERELQFGLRILLGVEAHIRVKHIQPHKRILGFVFVQFHLPTSVRVIDVSLRIHMHANSSESALQAA